LPAKAPQIDWILVYAGQWWQRYSCDSGEVMTVAVVMVVSGGDSGEVMTVTVQGWAVAVTVTVATVVTGGGSDSGTVVTAVKWWRWQWYSSSGEAMTVTCSVCLGCQRDSHALHCKTCEMTSVQLGTSSGHQNAVTEHKTKEYTITSPILGAFVSTVHCKYFRSP
jgi:hypothetical protein